MLSRVEVRAPPPPPILKIAFCAYLVGKKQFRFFPLFRFLDRQARCRLGTVVDLAFPLRSPETVLPASFPLPPRGASDQGVPWPRVGQTVVSRPRSESSSRRLTALCGLLRLYYAADRVSFQVGLRAPLVLSLQNPVWKDKGSNRRSYLNKNLSYCSSPFQTRARALSLWPCHPRR